MTNHTIAFIGCGNMGRSLISGLIAHGHPPGTIRGADVDPDQCKRTQQDTGIDVFDSNIAAITGADVVVLCVKPQTIRTTLTPLSTTLAGNRPLLLSVAAGIRISELERWSGVPLAVIRAMPNTPALIGAGAAALCANPLATTAQRDLATAIFGAVGTAIWLEDEALLDAVTALSGSGPAYFFYFIEIMERVGIELGLAPEQSRALTLQTALGAARMAQESGQDAKTLRKQVTSPGGTTEQALAILSKGDLEGLITQAMRAAQRRSRELAEQLGKES